MTDLVLGLIVGAVVALVVAGIVSWAYSRRLAVGHHQQVSALDTAVLELRQEAAEDKETNRRLRHELAVKTPSQLLETATSAEMDRDRALSERDQAIEQLDLVQRDLAAAKTRLGDQESKLRQYREALQEIRLSLEAQGRGRGGIDPAMLDTGELTGHNPAQFSAQETTSDVDYLESDNPQQETADLGAPD